MAKKSVGHVRAGGGRKNWSGYASSDASAKAKARAADLDGGAETLQDFADASWGVGDFNRFAAMAKENPQDFLDAVDEAMREWWLDVQSVSGTGEIRKGIKEAMGLVRKASGVFGEAQDKAQDKAQVLRQKAEALLDGLVPTPRIPIRKMLSYKKRQMTGKKSG